MSIFRVCAWLVSCVACWGIGFVVGYEVCERDRDTFGRWW